MKESKVTIIIPVYNAESFIERCLDSVFNQTYSNFEVICIDDGSKDKSLSVLKSYQKNHSNLKVVHQENQGASTARNLGLEKATGEYVTFVDSDDAIKPDFIAQMVSVSSDYDVVLSGYERRKNDGTEQVFAEGIPPQSGWAMYKFNSTCGKLYRRDFLIKNQIKFSPQYKIGEDMLFSMLVLAHTDKIKPIAYIGYINYLNQDSVTHRVNTSKENRNTKMLALLQGIEKATSPSRKIPVEYRLFFYLKTAVLHLLTQRHLLRNAEYYQEYQTYFTWLKSIYARYDCKLNFYAQNGEEPRVNFICNLFIFTTKTHTSRLLLNTLNNLHVAEIN